MSCLYGDSLISGILAGGSLVSEWSLLLLSPDVAHWGVFVWFCFVFYFGPFLGWHIRCMEFPLLVAILSLSFLLLVFVGCLFWFVCSFLVCVVFDGIAHWTVYWSTTSSFEAANPFDGLASKLQFSFSEKKKKRESLLSYSCSTIPWACSAWPRSHPNRTFRCSWSHGGIRRIPHCPLECTEGSPNSCRRCSGSPNTYKDVIETWAKEPHAAASVVQPNSGP